MPNIPGPLGLLLSFAGGGSFVLFGIKQGGNLASFFERPGLSENPKVIALEDVHPSIGFLAPTSTVALVTSTTSTTTSSTSTTSSTTTSASTSTSAAPSIPLVTVELELKKDNSTASSTSSSWSSVAVGSLCSLGLIAGYSIRGFTSDKEVVESEDDPSSAIQPGQPVAVVKGRQISIAELRRGGGAMA